MQIYKFYTFLALFYAVILIANSFNQTDYSGYQQAYEGVAATEYHAQKLYTDSALSDYGAQQKDTNWDNKAGNAFTMSFDIGNGFKRIFNPWVLWTPMTTIEHIFTIFIWCIHGITAAYLGLTIFFMFKANKND